MNKILVIIISSVFFISTIAVSEERDCSDPKGFHQKLMCKGFMQNEEGANSTLSDLVGKKTKKDGGLLKGFNPFKKINDINKKQKKTLF
jgi:hypothetical protein